MDQTALVGPDISAAAALVEHLERTDLQIEAAFRWLEDDTWKLIFATPLVHEQGARIVYSRIRDVIESTTDVPRDLFEKIQVVSPSAGVVTVLGLGADTHLPMRRFVLSESIGSAYVEGAYFYMFRPKTLARAS